MLFTVKYWRNSSCSNFLVVVVLAYHEHGTRHEVSYLIHYEILLQNATDTITKCDSYFIAKCDKSLLQNASGFLLQNATVLLQNATVITNCDDFITL